ncbi:MAG: hypothetical protein PVH87_18585 [Desulfobacteraceae bacterium]
MNTKGWANKAVVAALMLLLVACVRGYDVVVVNKMDVPVVIEMSQYHSEGFDGTPPREFTGNLLGRTQRVSLQAREQKKISFNDAGGGFWVRWHRIEPPDLAASIRTLDLIRDDLKIRITQQ